jgi:hypothetical protein
LEGAQYARALAAGQAEAEAEFRPQAVRYLPEWDAIEIVTTRNTGFVIPRQWIRALQRPQRWTTPEKEGRMKRRSL